MPLRYVILGLLFSKPMHGYALRKAIAPTLPTKQQVNGGVLYPLLRKLREEGLIQRQEEQNTEDDRPSRKVLSITEAGRKKLIEWLESQAAESEEVTYDFLLKDPFIAKAAFFRFLEPEERTAKFQQQLVRAEAKLTELEQTREQLLQQGMSTLHVAIVELAIDQQHEKIRWLQEVGPRIADKEYVEPLNSNEAH